MKMITIKSNMTPGGMMTYFPDQFSWRILKGFLPQHLLRRYPV